MVCKLTFRKTLAPEDRNMENIKAVVKTVWRDLGELCPVSPASVPVKLVETVF